MQVLEKTGDTLSGAALDLLVMTVNNAVIAERERCATIADKLGDGVLDDAPNLAEAFKIVANAIRNRK